MMTLKTIYIQIADEIRARGLDFDDITYCHEKHDSNKEAHWLARSLLRNDIGRYVWLIDPREGLCIPKILLCDQ